MLQGEIAFPFHWARQLFGYDNHLVPPAQHVQGECQVLSGTHSNVILRHTVQSMHWYLHHAISLVEEESKIPC